MATGDLKNNLRKLVSELKQVHFPQSELDLKGIAQGVPQAFLPALHHAFLDYSISLAEYFAAKEYDLYGKTDLRFLEAVYKVLRDEFRYKPQVTKEQFLTIGFAERKIISLCAILKLLRAKHIELYPKNSKSEKAKGKVSQPMNGRTTTKKNSSRINNAANCDYFPGPLPVDTDMKSFRSNKQAMEAGLGLKQPLVKRMVPDGDPEFEGNIKPSSERGGSVSSQKNSEQFKTGCDSTDLSLPSNLIVKASREEGHFGVKFPVSRNMEIRSNLCQQPPVFTLSGEELNLPRQPPKTVTWEDQAKDSLDTHSHPSEKVPQALPLSREPVIPISVPARIHSIPQSVTSPTYHPAELETAVGMTAIPFPVSMTTAPLPSPDLMLTPLVKGVQCGTIPVASSQMKPDLYHGLVSVENIPSTQVVRHSNPLKPETGEGIAPLKLSAQAETEVILLRKQVQDLQEKFDSVVLSNNEMSARVVLLESKMKLLEEVREKKCSCNNRSPLPATNKEKASREDDPIVVSGFNVHSDKDSLQEFLADAPTNEPFSTCYSDTSLKSVIKHNSTSRKLFKETEMSPATGDHGVKEPAVIDLTSFSEKSGDDTNSDESENNKQSASDRKSVLTGDKVGSIISPLPSVSTFSGVFKDQATKNTVVNVHKRLQETRELLARTNRDFAAKFNRYQ